MITRHWLYTAAFALGTLTSLNAQFTNSTPFSDQAVVGEYAPGGVPSPNNINRSATALDAGTFTGLVMDAFNSGLGGVVNWDAVGSQNGRNAIVGTFGDGLRFVANVDRNMQTTGSGGTFASTSGQRTMAMNSDGLGFTLTFGLTDANDLLLTNGMFIGQIGFVVASRTGAGYPLDVRVTTTFSDLSTEIVGTTINSEIRGEDDVFFGFTAPEGHSINSVQFEIFELGTLATDPVPFDGSRVAIDDLGFVAIPEPSTYAILLGLVVCGLAILRGRRRA